MKDTLKQCIRNMILTIFYINSAIRKDKIIHLKANLADPQLIFTQQALKSKAATIASLWVSHILFKNKKPYSDGVIFKNIFLDAADLLCYGFGN